jgi:hypothetical protein
VGVRTSVALLLVALAVAPAAGCGDDDAGEAAPTACLGGERTFLMALEGAPDEVLLDGATPISACLVEGQSGGELATVGEAMVGAATELNSDALRDPGGEATVQLGYLVGAVQEGAAATGGIHEDLVRRLDAAARYAPAAQAPSAEFERAFGEGYAAGQAQG